MSEFFEIIEGIFEDEGNKGSLIDIYSSNPEISACSVYAEVLDREGPRIARQFQAQYLLHMVLLFLEGTYDNLDFDFVINPLLNKECLLRAVILVTHEAKTYVIYDEQWTMEKFILDSVVDFEEEADFVFQECVEEVDNLFFFEDFEDFEETPSEEDLEEGD